MKIIIFNLSISLLLITITVCVEGKSKKHSNPPHCTQVTKDTDYLSKYKLDYPKAYIPPGQHEAYQQMFCISPPAVNKAVTVVCDWAAPPQVQFTLGDDYMHVVRQDPTGRYLGNAIITTYQLCSHNISHVEDTEYTPRITKLD
ncbi:uncharacterized protein LOC121726635 [Aricia agestis]|uniref:uncharacterized protein LOC121726635 n=1 Tax=Aricia agestis TaxID=91739 RepID=UPI001C203437|nr:uncharacterized protein LOC121726635 [Aricia agestis]